MAGDTLPRSIRLMMHFVIPGLSQVFSDGIVVPV